jgi:pimeloyl-ACP methyl ester carboxylesterase
MHRPSLVALACAALACAGPAPPVSGRWVGDAVTGEAVERIEVVFDSTGPAKVSLRSWGLSDAEARVVMNGADTLVVASGTGSDTAWFRGMRGDNAWAGVAARGRDTTRFDLRRVQPMSDGDWEHLVGTYRTGRGRLFGIGRLSEFGMQPMLVDYQTGRIGPLYPLSDRIFLLGSSVIAPLLPGDTVDLAADGLRLLEAGKAPVVAMRLNTRDQNVTFTNGDVRLAGTLTLPATAAPWPAIVLVHGSNALTRDVFGPWVRFFAGLGYAVLAYDKRGTGGSSGDWKEADFATLAGDVLAGVRFLQEREDIQQERIGLWGASQAGWIMPMVAVRAGEDIAFMIVHAGAGTTVREQGVLNLANELRFSGLSDKSVAVGLRYQALDDNFTKTGRGFEGVKGFYEANRGAEPWLWEPQPADAWFRTYYRMLMDFDPAPYWPRVKCPVLFFYGELDANVPPAESWPPIEAGLRKGGNHDVTQVVLPGANHLLLSARTGASDEYPRLSRFVPGYFDGMADWLTSVGHKAPTPQSPD